MKYLYDVYLASPLFCEEDISELIAMEDHLQKLGLKVFSPRHECLDESKILLEINHSLRNPDLNEDSDNARKARNDLLIRRADIADKIMFKNEHGIENSRFVFANIKGTYYQNALTADIGTVWETGFASGRKIPLVTYNFHGYGSNLMLSQSTISHISMSSTKDIKKIVDLAKELISEEFKDLNDSLDEIRLNSRSNNLTSTYRVLIKKVREHLFKYSDYDYDLC